MSLEDLYSKLISKENTLGDEFKESLNNIGKNHITETNSSFSPEEITYCPRRIIYKSLFTSINENIFIKNELIGEKRNSAIMRWQKLFKKNKYIEILDSNVVLVDCNTNLLGSADFVILFKDDKFLVRIYDVNDSDFNDLSKEKIPSKSAIESILLMWLADIDNMFMIFENNGETKIFHIGLLEQKVLCQRVIEATKEKCRKLFQYKIRGKIPNRPYKNISDECKQCNFLKECWKK